jgi:hypothetical protein
MILFQNALFVAAPMLLRQPMHFYMQDVACNKFRQSLSHPIKDV